MNHERKRKILFVITKSNWGGAQRYVFDLATSLQKEYDVAVALGGEGKLKELLEAQQIRVISIPGMTRDISLAQEWKAFLFLVSLFFKERPDIVHLNSSKAAGLGALAARLAIMRHIVFTAHAWAWNEERPLSARIAIALLHYLTVLLAHRTICVSNAVYDQMARFPMTRRRMRVIHLGITPLPRLEKSQARAHFVERSPALDVRCAFPWLIILGELHPIKGHRYALEALARIKATHPELTTLVVGAGEARESLHAYVTAHGLEAQVHFMGHIEDAGSLLPAFDIMLVPSLSEAFGYVLIEAGAAEVPVIASHVGGIPEIVEPDAGALVPPRNADAILGALMEALEDPDLRRSRALALKLRVVNHFTKERMVEDTKALYTDLLHR